jgi:hypothetical protein
LKFFDSSAKFQCSNPGNFGQLGLSGFLSLNSNGKEGKFEMIEMLKQSEHDPTAKKHLSSDYVASMKDEKLYTQKNCFLATLIIDFLTLGGFLA